MSEQMKRPNTPQEQGAREAWEAPVMGHCYQRIVGMPPPSLRDDLGARGLLLKVTHPEIWFPLSKVQPSSTLPLDLSLLLMVRLLGPSLEQ